MSLSFLSDAYSPRNRIENGLIGGRVVIPDVMDVLLIVDVTASPFASHPVDRVPNVINR